MKPTVCIEIVIAEDGVSKETHRALFSMPEKSYTIAKDNVPSLLTRFRNSGLQRIHLVGSWSWLLRLVLNERPLYLNSHVMYLLKNLGLEDEFLRIFKNTQVDDIFHTLYYGKRFDILRRLCHYVSAHVQDRVDRQIRFDCHMVSKDTGQIVASTL